MDASEHTQLPPGILPEPNEGHGVIQPASLDNATGVLRLRGLPFSAGEVDIAEFFKEYPLQTIVVCKRNGRSTGEAYVRCSERAAAADALQALNRKTMGHRYIEVFEASEADLNTAKALSVDRLKGYVIRMRGIPYRASASDVLKFFSGVDIVRGVEGVVFTHTPDGRPTGEAFVEVKDEEGQRLAMQKHKELMGTRYIELFHSTKTDMIQAIQHNRVLLGAYRKPWGPGPTAVPQPRGAMSAPAGSMGPTVVYTTNGPMFATQPGTTLAYVSQSPGAGGVEEMSDLFSGMAIQGGSHANAPHQQVMMPSQGFVAVQGGSGGSGSRTRYQQPRGGRGHSRGSGEDGSGRSGGSRQSPSGYRAGKQAAYAMQQQQFATTGTYNVAVAPSGAGGMMGVLHQQPYLMTTQQAAATQQGLTQQYVDPTSGTSYTFSLAPPHQQQQQPAITYFTTTAPPHLLQTSAAQTFTQQQLAGTAVGGHYAIQTATSPYSLDTFQLTGGAGGSATFQQLPGGSATFQQLPGGSATSTIMADLQLRGGGL